MRSYSLLENLRDVALAFSHPKTLVERFLAARSVLDGIVPFAVALAAWETGYLRSIYSGHQ